MLPHQGHVTVVFALTKSVCPLTVILAMMVTIVGLVPLATLTVVTKFPLGSVIVGFGDKVTALEEALNVTDAPGSGRALHVTVPINVPEQTILGGTVSVMFGTQKTLKLRHSGTTAFVMIIGTGAEQELARIVGVVLIQQ